MKFDRVVVMDWSAAKGPKTGKDSIWIGIAANGMVEAENIPTRAKAEMRLHQLLSDAVAAGERLLLGADFAFGYPAGFSRALTGSSNALGVWEWLAQRVTDAPQNSSNYRKVAAEMNALFGGGGPFWGNTEKSETPGLPRLKPPLPNGLASHRATEAAAKVGSSTPKSVWQLAGAGAVGAQSLTGIPVLARLRAAFDGRVSVWPFERPDAQLVFAEVYPSMLADKVAEMGGILDRAQVLLLAMALHRIDMAPLFQSGLAHDVEEGWILGAGHVDALRGALQSSLVPPRLRNDCFAMPQGVSWVPVKDALMRLQSALSSVTPFENVALESGLGRVLAADVTAKRSNPPMPNSAVDGYGFAHESSCNGVCRLRLEPGRAAAGGASAAPVRKGHAIRILTGAVLPEGVDTVVLEEDTATDGMTVVFDGPIKARANTRRAGEDIEAGALVLAAGHNLRAPDLALLAAVGTTHVAVHRKLRVGVFSTGDEVVTTAAKPHQIFDANRPMLLGLARDWGCEAVDLGHLADDVDLIRAALDRAAGRVDVIVTSGGASAGDEDHVSRLLRQEGTLSSWRIAMKPGRPLALAMWKGVPVFGLPGNPVAAFVCGLIFLRPAVSVLSGGPWLEPQGFLVPAAFSKHKKAGRREYLRARIAGDGRVEVFGSEGSGRISGLAWATGLVELPDHAMQVEPGRMVRFLPYSGFGLR